MKHYNLTYTQDALEYLSGLSDRAEIYRRIGEIMDANGGKFPAVWGLGGMYQRIFGVRGLKAAIEHVEWMRGQRNP